MSVRVAVLLALGVAACSGSAGVDLPPGGSAGSQSGASQPFVGTYQCTLTSNLTFASPVGAAPDTTTDTSLATISVNADGSITSTAPNGTGSACALSFTVSGNTATLESNQSCTVTTSGTTLSFAYTSGTAMLANDVLSGSSTFSFTGSVTGTGGPGTYAVAGSGSSTDVCMRQAP